MSEIKTVRDLTAVEGAVQQIVPQEASIQKAATQEPFQFHESTLAAQISACVSASYDKGKICVHFPIVGPICFSVNLPIPEGTTVKVCMETCGFRFGVPPFKGVKATVYFGNDPLWTGTIWGSC